MTTSLSKSTNDKINALLQLWEFEKQAVEKEFHEEQALYSLEEKVQRGNALKNMVLTDVEAAPAEKLMCWIAPSQGELPDSFRLSTGSPILLWSQKEDEKESIHAVLARRKRSQLGVMIDGHLPDFIEEGVFQVERDFPETTFASGKKAIENLRLAGVSTETGLIRSLLYLEDIPTFQEQKLSDFYDKQLNQSQQDAVQKSMDANEVACIHGPPGTGKTRTLVEVVRQHLAHGKSVLVATASNTALDNIAWRLVNEGVELLRLGHPARVSEKLEEHTLEARFESSNGFKLAKKWLIQARELQRSYFKKRERNQLSWNEKKEMRHQINQLFRDARVQMSAEQENIMNQHTCICATLVGCDSKLLGNRRFDVVVIDEATQAVDPLALIPMLRARRIILAGDPCQLPPTVIQKEKTGQELSKTFFERLTEHTPSCCSLLNKQYRMNTTLMAFPNKSMYRGKLTAGDANKHIMLGDIEVLPDFLRDQPLIFIDTSGKGWDEEKQKDNPSLSNPKQAERTAKECRRLLQRNLCPSKVAVITPYHSQVLLLRRHLADYLEKGLEIGSVDGFQGREKEAIIIDLVRSNDKAEIGFLNDIRRMNVAITRAKRSLFIIGDSATIGNHTYFSALFEAIEQCGSWISVWEDDAPSFEA